MPDPRALVWRQIDWPSPLDGDLALEVLRHIAADVFHDDIIFEALGDKGSISHFYATSARTIRQLTHVIETVTGATTLKVDHRPTVRTTARLTLSGGRLPLAPHRELETSRQALGALAAAAFAEERALLRVTLGPSRRGQLLEPRPADPGQSWPSKLFDGLRPAAGEVANRMRAKSQEVGFRAFITAGAEAKSEGRRRTVLGGVLAALRTMESAGTRLEFVRSTDDSTRLRFRPNLDLTVSEVLSLLAWPLGEDNPGMPPSHPRPLRLRSSNIERRRVFAETAAPGEPQPLGISIEDALTHTVFLGPTNAGKSTAMLRAISSDIEAGRSVVVVDPKSDLNEAVLGIIPPTRYDDVVVIDPTDESRPVAINPFQSPGVKPELLADAVLNIIRDLFPSAFGPRTSDAVHAAALLVANHPKPTLTMLPRVFSEPRLRRELLAGVSDPDGVEAFWNYYEALSDGAQAQMVGPVLSRLRQFLMRESLRALLDQPEPRFQLAELFTNPRIVLLSLNSGLLGQTAAALLGSLFVAQLQQLTLARAQVSPNERRPVSIFVDEVQTYIGTTGAQIEDSLNRSRALGVAWHLAHQFRSQMPREVLAAIDANALNKVSFRLQADDARAMAAMAPELTAEDFMALPRFGIYANLQRGGESLGWVLGRTLPAPEPISDPAELRRRSAERYGRDPLAPVPRTPIPDRDAPIGRRPRTPHD